MFVGETGSFYGYGPSNEQNNERVISKAVTWDFGGHYSATMCDISLERKTYGSFIHENGLNWESLLSNISSLSWGVIFSTSNKIQVSSTSGARYSVFGIIDLDDYSNWLDIEGGFKRAVESCLKLKDRIVPIIKNEGSIAFIGISQKIKALANSPLNAIGKCVFLNKHSVDDQGHFTDFKLVEQEKAQFVPYSDDIYSQLRASSLLSLLGCTKDPLAPTVSPSKKTNEKEKCTLF